MPRRVIVEHGFHHDLINVGCCLSGGEYNHSLARLIGCLLLEHNTFVPLSSDIRTKIGGASPLTATRLTGKAAEIQKANAARFPDVLIHDVRKLFSFDELK